MAFREATKVSPPGGQMSSEEFAMASFQLDSIGDLHVPKQNEGFQPPSHLEKMREHVSVVVGKGKSKQVFGKTLSQDDVVNLDEKHLISMEQKYRAFVSSKMASSLKKAIVSFGAKMLSQVLVIKDIECFEKELNEDYLINNELEGLFSSISVENTSYACKALSLANAALITLNNTDLEGTLKWWSSEKSSTTSEVCSTPDEVCSTSPE